jgi:hypothetical protein
VLSENGAPTAPRLRRNDSLGRDQLSRSQDRGFLVQRIHENDAPAVVNAAITIVQTASVGVELVVRSDCHHDVAARLKFDRITICISTLQVIGKPGTAGTVRPLRRFHISMCRPGR